MKALIFVSMLFLVAPLALAESAKDCVERIKIQHDKTDHKGEMALTCIRTRLYSLFPASCGEAVKLLPDENQGEGQKICDEHFSALGPRRKPAPSASH